MDDFRAIILAAGKGTRMKSELPKVLHKVCGKPLIQYVTDLTRSLKTYVVLGHKAELVEEALGSGITGTIQKEQLGTAHAVQCVEGHFKDYNGHVLILCGDTPLLQEGVIKQLIRKHKSTKASCTILTAVLKEPAMYGRMVRNIHGDLTAIREFKDATDDEKAIAEINSGVYCFESRALFSNLKQIKLNPKKKEFYLTDIVEHLLSQGKKVETLVTEDESVALGVNDRKDLAEAEAILRRRILNRLMEEGVTIVDPNTTYIDDDVRIGCDTVIYPFTVIHHDVRIGSNCSIGPFARLRPGTRIGNHVEIGNFGEVSRSKISDGTVMKHFGFLGDAVVGADVNIGAGTITANYDGKNKTQTVIGDHAFIGSDTVLIAPVKVGKKAMTAAGAVVTKGKNIPDEAVAKGVPAQIFLKGKKK